MSLIIATSQDVMIYKDVIVPFGSAFLGGLLAVLAGVIQGALAAKHAKEARKKELSVESARNVDTQLLELEHIMYTYTDSTTGHLKSDGIEKIASRCTEMELHRRYIDDATIQQAVREAVQFLRPDSPFDASPGESTATVIKSIIRWLRPMLEAHVMDRALPPEPAYVQSYRDAYEDAKARWDRFWSRFNPDQSPKEQ